MTAATMNCRHTACDLDLEADFEFPKYATSEQVAAWAGTDVRWVQAQVRRGVATPALTKGERQFDRAGVLRLLLLARLQRMFGAHSPVPFKILERSGDAIEALLRQPTAGTILLFQDASPLGLVVNVPGLHELFAPVGA